MTRMRRVVAMALLSAGFAAALIVTTPAPAEASIHEIIAALCRAGGEEVVPPGQNRGGQSFVRALQATGFITSIEFTETLVTINFDPTVAPSKFMSAGMDLLIPNGAGDGVDLLLSPLVVPNPAFPAHANCHNLRE